MNTYGYAKCKYKKKMFVQQQVVSDHKYMSFTLFLKIYPTHLKNLHIT